ncbi:MAG TPA: type II secretion system protein GspM [Thermodesulfobacteriota bacterium]|nr:type II secretion system protein GspM [Thermodesulfobacteriota bacterium]
MTTFFKKYSFIKKIKFKSKRERSFVFVTLGCVIAFFAIPLIIRPFLVKQRDIRGKIPLKAKQLETCRQFIAGRSQMEKNLTQFQALSKTHYQRLLCGDTPPLAAANLQNILKHLADKNLISIKSEKVLDAKALNFFTQIPVQIEFITTITNITSFLYDIENNEKALIIPDLNIRSASYRDPKDIRVTIIVAGLMKETKNNR